jgi:hypothetical protein
LTTGADELRYREPGPFIQLEVLSEEASLELWDDRAFRWIIVLSEVRRIHLPLAVVREGAGFAASYTLNRQALVPKQVREASLWAAIAPYLSERVEPIVRRVPVESHLAEAYPVRTVTEDVEAHRFEAELVERLCSWWAARDGSDAVCRLEIRPTPDSSPLYVDAFNAATNELVEAKASTSRSDIRMGVGQLADYRRFVDGEPTCLLLLPEKPSDDLFDLLVSLRLSLLVPAGSGFVRFS